MKRWFSVLCLVVIMSMLATACAAPTPQVIKETVQVEKVVEKPVEKIVEKQVVQTQVVEKQVEKQVVVTATPKPLPKDAKLSLSIFRGMDSWDPKNAYSPLIEKAVGFPIFWNGVPGADYVEKRNVIMASGNYPNAIQLGVCEPAFQQYYDDGLLLPLDDYLKKHPVVWNMYPQEVWDALRQKDGKIYTIPRLGGVYYPQVLNYRRDWLDALGMKEPKTLDEFRAYLQAVKDKDPGKIGKDKLIPFVPNRLSGGQGLALTWVEPIMAAFGTPYNTWIPSPQDPNKIVYAPTLPEFKDALVYLRGLMKDGLMDQTYLVSKDRGLFKYYAGTVGATTDWPQFVNLRREAIQNAIKDAKPVLNYVPGLVGPKGVKGGPVLTPDPRGDCNPSFALTMSASPAQAEAFFKLLEWEWTDGHQLLTLGVEGKSFDVVNGVAKRRGRDAILKDSPEYDLYMLDRLLLVPLPKDMVFRSDNPAYADIPENEMKYVTPVLNDTIQNWVNLNYAVNTNDKVITDNIADIQSKTEEFASKVILNPNLDVNAEYDAYLKALKQTKFDEVAAKINELNKVKDVQASWKALQANYKAAMEAK
jgi:ABC-type glycerol-3-phosphate transport system substrate-binding protein